MCIRTYLYQYQLTIDTVLILEHLNINDINQLCQLLYDLIQNLLIAACHNCHAGVARISGLTYCEAVNIIAAAGEKACHTAQHAGGIVHQQ